MGWEKPELKKLHELKIVAEKAITIMLQEDLKKLENLKNILELKNVAKVRPPDTNPKGNPTGP